MLARPWLKMYLIYSILNLDQLAVRLFMLSTHTHTHTQNTHCSDEVFDEQLLIWHAVTTYLPPA